MTGKRKRSISRGFTMIEMVVVIVIMALLASIATPLYFRHVKKARVGAAKAQIRLLEQAIFDFRLDMAKLPDNLGELVENVSGNEKWDGPYLSQRVPRDPWGNEYEYRKPGEYGDFDLISYGADGLPGGTGENSDIGNWGDNE